ncbi:hypothetical protein JZ751_006653 [Albula glossodonta]|uniref:Uncharacterized protein n=1 Tax=Albula glossodonta TaxID=121402 RepID=A0A8T2P9P0_9TELE|nr:hypothetical protein JZ751_006653 [Albula glossodonta]
MDAQSSHLEDHKQIHVQAVFPLATPGQQQTAEDAGKAAVTVGQLSQCQADWQTVSLLLLGLRREEREWDESLEFCEQHNASLAVIRNHREMVWKTKAK